MKWKLKPAFFHGPRTYIMDIGDKTIKIDVDHEGIFEFDCVNECPIHVIAESVERIPERMLSN